MLRHASLRASRSLGTPVFTRVCACISLASPRAPVPFAPMSTSGRPLPPGPSFNDFLKLASTVSAPGSDAKVQTHSEMNAPAALDEDSLDLSKVRQLRVAVCVGPWLELPVLCAGICVCMLCVCCARV